MEKKKATNTIIPQEYDDTSVVGSMGKSSALEEQLKFLNEVNKVEGFNPLSFGYKKWVAVLGEHEEQLHAPVKILKTWFRLKYPCGKLKCITLDKGEDYCTAECRVYTSATDSDEAFIGQGRTTVKYDSTNPDMNLESAAWTYATGKALNDAGFGLQFGYDAKLYKNLPGMDSEKITKQVIEENTSGFKPEINTKVTEKEIPKASVLDLIASEGPKKEVSKVVETKTTPEEIIPNELSELDKKVLALTGFKSLMTLEEAKNVICVYEKCKGSKMSEIEQKFYTWFIMPTIIERFGEDGKKMAMASYILSKELPEIAAAVQRKIA